MLRSVLRLPSSACEPSATSPKATSWRLLLWRTDMCPLPPSRVPVLKSLLLVVALRVVDGSYRVEEVEVRICTEWSIRLLCGWRRGS
jgi:hypothetical protein